MAIWCQQLCFSLPDPLFIPLFYSFSSTEKQDRSMKNVVSRSTTDLVLFLWHQTNLLGKAIVQHEWTFLYTESICLKGLFCNKGASPSTITFISLLSLKKLPVAAWQRYIPLSFWWMAKNFRVNTVEFHSALLSSSGTHPCASILHHWMKGLSLQ